MHWVSEEGSNALTAWDQSRKGNALHGLPLGSLGACTTRHRQWPSWSSFGAGNWPCYTCYCSKMHLQTEDYTEEKEKKIYSINQQRVTSNSQMSVFRMEGQTFLSFCGSDTTEIVVYIIDLVKSTQSANVSAKITLECQSPHISGSGDRGQGLFC